MPFPGCVLTPRLNLGVGIHDGALGGVDVPTHLPSSVFLADEVV